MTQLIPFSVDSFLADATTNFPQFLTQTPSGTFRNSLRFSHSTSQKCRSPQFHMPAFTGVPSIRLTFAIPLTSGNVAFRVAVEAIKTTDNINTNTTRSFDTANNSGAIAVPANTYNTKDIIVPWTNRDGVTANDMVTFTIDRDISVASNATDFCYLYAVSLEDES